jgi:hypothetical protein
MSNYTIAVDWSGKDALSDSDAEKVISGSDFNTEFTALQTAVNTKADINGSASEAFAASTVTATTGTITTGTVTTLTSTTGTIATLNSTTANITTVDLGDWTITEAAGVLYFATGGVNKMKVDATGNLTCVGDVIAYGTI